MQGFHQLRTRIAVAASAPLRTHLPVASSSQVAIHRRSICVTKQTRSTTSPVETGSPPFARVFGFPFGLHDHDALLSEYRSCRDVETAKSLLAEMTTLLATESHALELESHLLAKSAQGLDSSSDVYLDMASRVDLWSACIERLPLDLQVERIRKEFVLYPPPTSDDAAPPQSDKPSGVRFNVEWSTSRHSSRKELAPFAYHMRIVATPFLLSSSPQDPDAHPERKDESPILLLDVSDADDSRVDVEAIDSLRTQFAGRAVTPRQWAWFLSFLSTHPTDLAFDVVSECLLRQRAW